MSPSSQPSEPSRHCPSCGAQLAHSGARADASGAVTAPDPREHALMRREQAIEERENDLQRRENLFALRHEQVFALKVQGINDAQIAKATRDYRNAQIVEPAAPAGEVG